MILNLVYYDDKRLRTKCEPIEEITDEIKKLARDMIDTMRAFRGIGLAAPQVGKLIRLFVLDFEACDEEGYPILGTPVCFINPVLSKPSEELIEDSEGCLSIPGLHMDVSRPIAVTITAQDLYGKTFTIEASDYLARAIMHENDHINGVLFIDRLPPAKRKEIEPELKKIKKKHRS